MKFRDLSGKQFGELTVLGLSEMDRSNRSRWSVRCSCGVEKTVQGTHLVSGATRSCGHLQRRARNWKGVGKVPLTYFSQVRRHSAESGRRPVEFSITLDYVAELYEKQDGKCAYSGLPIDFKSKTASLDRIDSSKGCIIGNVQWLHKDVNMMKRHYSEDYFLRLCRLVGVNCEVT